MDLINMSYEIHEIVMSHEPIPDSSY
jgi:hypothetical protein